MKLGIITLLALFIFSLVDASQINKEDFVDQSIKRLKNLHMKRQMETHGFSCSSLGGGGNGKQYTHLSFGFNTRERLTIKAARRLMVESTLNFIRDVNLNDNYRECFTEWPITENQLMYKINVLVGNGVWPIFPNGPPPDNKISYVEFYKGEIDYNIEVHPKKLPQTIHSETLEEAISILKAEGWSEPTK